MTSWNTLFRSLTGLLVAAGLTVSPLVASAEEAPAKDSRKAPKKATKKDKKSVKKEKAKADGKSDAKPEDKGKEAKDTAKEATPPADKAAPVKGKKRGAGAPKEEQNLMHE